MDIQLYPCTRLNARISLAQCNRNRNGVPHAPGKPGRPACLSCSGCSGLDMQVVPVPVVVLSPPVAAPVAVSQPVPKRRGGQLKPRRRRILPQPEVSSMPVELQQRILRRTMVLLAAKQQRRTA